MDELHYKPKYPVHTLGKALDILAYLKNNISAEGVSIIELSENLDLGKSSVHRMLDTLLAYNFVEKSNNGSSYRLGWGLFDAGNAVPKQHTLNNSNYIHLLEKLCNDVSETINLGIVNHNEVVIIYKIEPNVRIRANVQIGGREPLYATSLGKLFMCNFTHKEIENYYQTHIIKKLTANTIVSADEMILETTKIKSQGFSIDNKELFEDLMCISMPIKDFNGKIVAAISISGPAERLEGSKIEAIRPNLKKVCEELSEYMGFK